MQQELQNIKEFKTNKVKEAFKTITIFLLNEFLLNMLSDQIRFSVNFNLLF